jgi:hypothetical protein
MLAPTLSSVFGPEQRIRGPEGGHSPMSMNGGGPRPSWIPGHARRHERTGELDTRWMPACQCGWSFYASVRTLRIADRTHGFHLDRVHASRQHAAS